MRVLARPFLYVPLIIAAVVALGWFLLLPHAEKPQPVTPLGPQMHSAGPQATPVTGAVRPSQMVAQAGRTPLPEQLPASLIGTSVPTGWVKLDGVGELIPTPALRQLFEYYLSALGEESLAQLVARIEQTLSVLEEPARSQARNILGAYLDYKLAISELEAAYAGSGDPGPAEMQRRMQEVHALRRTWLDQATAEAFFARDEAIDRFQIEKLRIARDPALTGAQRQAALAQAESALPEPLRRARQETRRFADYEQARQALADDPAALRAWRQQAFDAATAGRLAALEQEQQAWDRRWQAYSRERQALLVSGLAGPELDAAIDHLRAQHFDETERVRAQGLDSIR